MGITSDMFLNSNFRDITPILENQMEQRKESGVDSDSYVYLYIARV